MAAATSPLNLLTFSFFRFLLMINTLYSTGKNLIKIVKLVIVLSLNYYGFFLFLFFYAFPYFVFSISEILTKFQKYTRNNLWMTGSLFAVFFFLVILFLYLKTCWAKKKTITFLNSVHEAIEAILGQY